MSTSRPDFSLLSVVANIERHKLGSDEPWLLAMDIVYPGSANITAKSGTNFTFVPTQNHLRLVRNTDPITFDSGDGNGPQEYAPFNFSVGDYNISSNGSVPELKIEASNTMRVIQGLIEQYSGLVGADLFLYAINTANPAGEPELSMAFEVKQVSSDAKLVHFTLGAASPLRRLFPIHKFRPDYCIWQYKGPQCKYAGTMTTCSHTMEGATGCNAHNNVVNFGAFPGIDTNGAVVASS